MKDQFVTYEIARRLKELGFNGPCIGAYDEDLENKDLKTGSPGCQPHLM